MNFGVQTTQAKRKTAAAEAAESSSSPKHLRLNLQVLALLQWSFSGSAAFPACCSFPELFMDSFRLLVRLTISLLNLAFSPCLCMGDRPHDAVLMVEKTWMRLDLASP
ncbi:hypothetical protein HPP92_012794 [Vanilla planifolia]|uniref:Uncharacterized protein n=1 Tax=Vanilla planifolia TaxID=51239 RepID=A0A835QWV4_VANPL|nr:hypothetical protein HPP92_012794 [Vanilla planifolia]